MTLQATQDEIQILIKYWRDKIAKNAGRRPNVSAQWVTRLEEWREELRTAPHLDRPYRQLVAQIMEQELLK